ncbi:MAG: chemotaxis protein CheA [Chloroflexi bacterium]|nr:chemotaxis protein CheA [Chloroflexota bacterium]
MTNLADGFDVSAFMGEFVQEIEERIQAITSGLLELERNPDNIESLHDVFRAAHSIKGAAKIMGLETIARVAHSMEDVFETLEREKKPITPALNDLLLRGIDAIEIHTRAAEKQETASLDVDELCEALVAAAEGKTIEVQAEPAETPVPDIQSAARPTTIETLRVSVGQIDRLVSISSELTMTKLQSLRYLRELGDLAARLRKLGRETMGQNGNDRTTEKQDSERSVWATNQLRDLYRYVSELELTYEQYLDVTDDLTDQLKEQVLYMRLLPVSTVLSVLPRAARDLARQQGKDVRLTIEGGETALDREIIEGLASPLIHLLRNAVDHGIEPVDERITRGKPPSGHIHISATLGGDRVQITVEDDGRGIDPSRIKSRAVEKGIISTAEAEQMDDDQAIELIFHDGLSTSKQLTDTSGRGVGMSAARQQVEALRGTFLVSSDLGKGTRFVLTFPLSLSTVHALFVECGGYQWALPTLSVVSTGVVRAEAIQRIDGRLALRYRDKIVPLAPLYELLENKSAWTPNGNAIPVVILRHTGLSALAVDHLLDEQEVISKSLGPFLANAPKTAGATIMGDGRIVIILDTAHLAKLIQTWRPQAS